MNLLRKQVTDKRVTDLIKKYLKSGVMENGVRSETEEGSPQGGPLSPLLANIYLNEFDQEMERRGVNVIRYADDIVVLARSKRAAIRRLETGRRYLENKLKLTINAQKSKVVSLLAQKHFKFLGYALGKNGSGVYTRTHRQILAKAKKKLKELTSRSQGRNARKVIENVKVYIRGCTSGSSGRSRERRYRTCESWEYRRGKHTNGGTLDWDIGELLEVRYCIAVLQMKSSHRQGIMTSLRSTSIALKRLNRRIPKGTYGGVRGWLLN